MEDILIFKGATIYLDKNIWSNLLKAKEPVYQKLLQKLTEFNKSEDIKVLYSSYIIEEVSKRDDEEKITKELELIRKITKSNFIDYRSEINNYTIRVYDPFECYEAIREVSNPCKILADFPELMKDKKLCTEAKKLGVDVNNIIQNLPNLLNIIKPFLKFEDSLFNLIPTGYQEELRKILGLGKIELNNIRNIKELIDEFNLSLLKFHNEQILSNKKYKGQYLQQQGNLDPLTFDKIINKLISIICASSKANVSRHQKNLMILSFIKSIGFKCDERIDKRVNEFYDICHSLYPCTIFISNDKKLLDFHKARGLNALNAKEFIKNY